MVDVKIIFFIIAEIFIILGVDLIFYKIYSKKCGYDCSKCKYWSCPAKSCMKKLNKIKPKD